MAADRPPSSHAAPCAAPGGNRRLLRGSLLGGAGASTVMLTDGASALASSLRTLTPSQLLLNFKEMGLLGWLLVDLGINWLGWAAAAAFKVR